MKRSIFFLILIAITCLGHTKPITEQEAIQIAKNFYFQKESFRARTLSTTSIIPQFSISYACRSEKKLKIHPVTPQDVYYYVININSNDGFIIISGDDRAKQILAYSNEGSFNPDNVPVNCSNWLEGYKEEISKLISSPEENTENFISNKTYDYPTEIIEPLIKTHWGQGEPFNLQCPIDEKNNNISVVGCVATATAQIMYYHKWPERPTGLIEYKDSKQNVNRKMNFDERPAFDWNNMLLDYSDKESSEIQNNAVANLMVCAGYASQMGYGSTASGANPKNTAVSLSQYFNYDPNIHYYENNLLTNCQWLEIIMQELSSKRPILYSGFNPEAGHSFVCDGYDGNGMFHFNWGWNGKSDGYYSLSSLNPNDQGLGGSAGSYTFNQYIVTNIQRPSSETKPQKDYPTYSYLSIADKSWVFYDDKPLEQPKEDNFAIAYYLKNAGMTKLNGMVNVGIVNENNQITLLSTNTQVNISTAANASQWCANWVNVKDFQTGVYKIYGLYKPSDTDNWSIIQNNLASPNSFLMTITEKTVRIERIFPYFSIALNGDFNPGATYSNVLKIWNINITNNSDVRLSGKVGIQLRKKGESSSSGSLYTALAYCDPGENTSVKVSANMNIGEGDFIVTPFYCNDNSITGTVNFKNITPLCEGIPIKTTKKPMIFIDSAIKNYTLDKKDNLIKVSITQPSSKIPWENGRVYAKIFKKEENKDIDTNCYLYSDPFTMNIAFQTKIVDLKGESIDLPTGNNYKITFYMDDGNESVIGSADLSIIQTVTSIANDFMANLNICFNQGSSKLIITSESPLYKLDITNISGNIIQVVQLNGLHNAELQANNLTSGIYLIRIQTDKKTITKKIIIP